MSTSAVASVLVHVDSVEAALVWYRRAFPHARLAREAEGGYEFLTIGDIALELVPADSKVSSGPCGSVVYWRVERFEEALLHFQAVGATLYRGPMAIEQGERMCQVRDPWGNCIGLRGASTS